MRRWINSHQSWTVAVTLALLIGAYFASPAISQFAELATNKILQANTGQPITIETDGDGVKIGNTTTAGTPISQIVKYAASLGPTAITTNLPLFQATSVYQTFTVTGLSTSDLVFVNGPSPTNRENSLGCVMTAARVSAANTLQLQFTRTTTATCTPATGTYDIWAIRQAS